MYKRPLLDLFWLQNTHFWLCFYRKITFWDILTPCCAKIVDMGMYHHLNLKVQVLTFQKSLNQSSSTFFNLRITIFCCMVFRGNFQAVFDPPQRGGKSAENFFG